jgi:hypothetical protein
MASTPAEQLRRPTIWHAACMFSLERPAKRAHSPVVDRVSAGAVHSRGVTVTVTRGMTTTDREKVHQAARQILANMHATCVMDSRQWPGYRAQYLTGGLWRRTRNGSRDSLVKPLAKGVLSCASVPW